MTSGQFESIAIDNIWVDRAKRQRSELAGIEELADSIRQNGLIHPPVIKRDGELIVGERRWNACKSIGWTHIPIQWVDELDELELQALEFEENIRRVDISWHDRTLAIQRYHRLKMAQDLEWNQGKTAERLGVTDAVIGRHLQVAQAIEEGNSTVKAAPRFSIARNIIRRTENRKNSSSLARLDEITTGESGPAAPILNVDFHEWQATYDGPRFNFIHCDFPYGIGIQRSERAAGAGFGTYDDQNNVYWELVHRLKLGMVNVVASSAHLMFWFHMERYTATVEALTAMGWRVNPMPLIWFKSDNTGIVPDPNRGPRQVYETCLFASRGDRYIRECVGNAFSFPGRQEDKLLHMNQKPKPMLKHFMRMFVDDTSIVLDPTCGSASALQAAQTRGSKQVLGLERDKEFFDKAVEHFFDPDLSQLSI